VHDHIPADNGHGSVPSTEISGKRSWTRFLSATLTDLFVAQRTCAAVRTAQVLGLALALSVDSVVPSHGLRELLRVIMQTTGAIDHPNLLCVGACWVPELLALWDVVFVGYLVAHALLTDGFSDVQAFLRSHSTADAQRGEYAALRTTEPAPAPEGAERKSTHRQRTFNYPNALVYNYFDPDAIPEILEAYSETIFPVVQQLSRLHGFQIDNSRNQAEHLLFLLFNETKKEDSMTSLPAQRLHLEMFANYRKWCARLGVKSSLTKDVAPVKNFECLLEDMLLFLLVWGEAANLKHMPECLCCLLHKVLEEHADFKNATTWTYPVDERGVPMAPAEHSTAMRYPGFFLDMVVTPMYEVVAAALTQSGDHLQRMTYDDFNEFFWTSACLRCELHDAGRLSHMLMTPQPPARGEAAASDRPPLLATALANCSKTYMEKRSWLHPLQSMNRVFEWHVITFTLLAALAFANMLQWTYAYALQAGSFVFWEISFMGIVWTALEVWTLFPGVKISDPSKWGYLLRLLAGLLILTYQSIYFHWSYVTSDDTSLQKVDVFHAARESAGSMPQTQSFWWWQYIWLSLLSCTLYLLESLLCWFPGIVDALMTWDNDIVQAFLNVCYPLSQLYVAKVTNIKQTDVFVYIFFWLTLLAFKLWFGYRFIVAPVSVPTLEFYDDYMNFYGGPEEVSFVKTATIMFFWWFPHFLVYIIDLSIWYSVWAAIVGGFLAIIDRQGAVRESPSFRVHFMRAPEAIAKALLPVESDLREDLARNLSTASLTGIERTDEPFAASASTATPEPTVSASSVHKDRGMKQNRATKSTADIGRIMKQASARTTAGLNGQKAADLGTNADAPGAHRMLEALDRRSQRWVVFGRVWNEIIERLWLSDHINLAEKNIFLFTKFDWLSKPIYLPLFQTAGSVSMALVAFRDSSEDFQRESDVKVKMQVLEKFKSDMGVAAHEAVSEAWEIAVWVFQRLMGTVHYKDVERLIVLLSNWAASDLLFSRFNGAGLEKILTHFGNIVNVIMKAIPKRKAKPVVTTEYLLQRSERLNAPKVEYTSDMGGGRVKKSISTGFLSALGEAPQTTSAAVPVPLHSTTDSTSKSPTTTGGKSKRASQFQALQPLEKSGDLEDTLRDKVRDELRNLLNLVRAGLKIKTGISAESQDLIDRLTFMLTLESGFIWNDEYASTQLDDIATDHRMPKVLEKLQGLLQLRISQVELRSFEARRRLNFFLNSLFMDIPAVSSMRFSKEYTTVTPYYSEDILLSKGTLQETNTDGVSVILYLQTLFKTDWLNFLERRSIRDEQQIWSAAHLQELRMWASCRAQTLFRTVEGMMYTEAAIRLLADLEECPDCDKEVFAKVKFNYVVACQIYGPMKQSLDPKADDIEFLLARYENLRVAYVDMIRAPKTGELTYYSVLIKHDPKGSTLKSRHPVSEVYRVKLPGNPIIGEGKPENQNHALIFTRGRYLQAVDMNQDGYFEEALKMRNLLEEFDSGCSILGFREHIFTGSVSSVANYMAMQELSFVTLGQRVLYRPLRIRQHYGHPDVFRKLFVMTEGGMSKASRGINLSEDVFAGFNATLRGHSVHFAEYVQVGKGRDVGLQQTYKFEAKLSQGNAEQSLSRDMSRICGRLDFFRLLSFYYGGIGHYMANTMVMFTLVVVVYTMTALAIYNEEGVNSRPMRPEGMLQLLLAGMGILQTMPLLVTLTVERGVWQAVSDIGFMMVSGGPLYFIFHIETKSYYFSQTLMAGGAMYRPTGRGFVTQHSSFDENYRFFAASHIYLGFELFVALILYGVHTSSKQYAGLTWSLWLTVVAFLLGPFWFNPLSFEWDRIKDDYIKWTCWMAERGGTSEQAWEAWWKEETRYYHELSFTWKVFLAVQRLTPWILLSVGVAGPSMLTSWNEQRRVLELLAVVGVFVFANWVLSKLERTWIYAVRRFATLLVWAVAVCVLVRLYVSHMQYIRYSLSLYYIGASLTVLMLLTGFHSQVANLCKVHDYVVGHCIFALLAVLALLQVPPRICCASLNARCNCTTFYLFSWAISRPGCCTTMRCPLAWRSKTSCSTRAARRTSWASCALRWQSSRS
jgi:hypothetical protein